MLIAPIVDRFKTYGDRFKSFLTHRKQLRALANYSEVADFGHKKYLKLLAACMSESFLDEKEAGFLSYMVDKYGINYLDWSYRNPWLKSEMRRMREATKVQQPARQLTMFDDIAIKNALVMGQLGEKRNAISSQPVGKMPWPMLLDQMKGARISK